MTATRPVAVLGAAGGVGSAAVRHLAAAGVGPLRLGGRRPERAARLLDELGTCAEVVAVDAGCPESLARFCAGSRLVVNCAGPSHRLLDGIARAAVAAGADLVEAGGDDVHRRLADLDPGPRRLVLSAGLMPGLSGVLPRCLAAGFERPRRLTAYAGGRGRLTPAAAADYLAGLQDGAGEPLAAWERGCRRSRALTPLRDVELPHFPGRVTAQPYLSVELERVARDLSLEEARWYNVFDGVHLAAALARLQGSGDPAAADEVARAAALDVFGREPYQLLVLQLEGGAGGAEACRTLLLRAGDGIDLTGAVTALVARAVLAGEIEPGLHHTDAVLGPRTWCERLRALPEVRALAMVDGPAALEEGVV